MSAVYPVVPAASEPKRPLGLLVAYSWDMFRALVAVLAALAAFSGGLDVNGRTVVMPGWAQVVMAVSNASYAATLIVLGIVLTRHQKWVRSVQIGSLVAAIVFAVASVLAQRVTDPVALAFNGVFIAIDILAIVVMNSATVRAWYPMPGTTPRYVTVLLGFWAVVSVGAVAYMVTLTGV